MFESVLGSASSSLGANSALRYGLVALGVLIVLALVIVWWRMQKRRARLGATAKFFARNFLRPGYVEITFTHQGSRPVGLGSLVLASQGGHAVDRTPLRDHRGRALQTLSTDRPTLVCRISYAGQGSAALSPVDGHEGAVEPLVTGWFTVASNKGQHLVIDGLTSALEKLHQDKQQHDLVEARRNGDASAGVDAITGRAAERHKPASRSHSRGAASKRRRNQQRKSKK